MPPLKNSWTLVKDSLKCSSKTNTPPWRLRSRSALSSLVSRDTSMSLLPLKFLNSRRNSSSTSEPTTLLSSRESESTLFIKNLIAYSNWFLLFISTGDINPADLKELETIIPLFIQEGGFKLKAQWFNFNIWENKQTKSHWVYLFSQKWVCSLVCEFPPLYKNITQKRVYLLTLFYQKS